ncbi:N-acetylmuramic acid 6-phosphate etherase [Caproiciproducens galactitolivorans]|uniref:N-acetylmuramic acid 6-phosphate etherase n=1 Tax=Caproiciproducens galactitolivorans TaxID=642589 RepID=A0ABT4BTK2_9FIRM|nr:N-acetylmuramic acid 6-phosphate etherase [Caproiciproducens galactitolivorans]MCY1713408.1 N-acetylmuramic acid 6-phosphate etherase [Caproiciproducens galactitolivorans]
MIDLDTLDTEKINADTKEIDRMNTIEILQTINKEDKSVAYAVEKVIPSVGELIDEAFKRLQKGGRVIYVGAGTSGRLGVLDASECPPTYGIDPEMIQGLIAGGFDALIKAKEGAEDDAGLGREDLKNIHLTEKDTVIGLAASGRTPYVVGALDYANETGAFTGAISCVRGAEISRHAKVGIEAVVGPEVITGSTRMKAGTAQKMILNMISTSLMIMYGKVYHNLMVDVQATNAKLVERAKRIIELSSGCDKENAEKYWEASGLNVKIAICMAITGLSREDCEALLNRNGGNISRAIHSLKEHQPDAT